MRVWDAGACAVIVAGFVVAWCPLPVSAAVALLVLGAVGLVAMLVTDQHDLTQP